MMDVQVFFLEIKALKSCFGGLQTFRPREFLNSLRRPTEACAGRKPLLRDVYNTGAESGSEGLVRWCSPRRLSFNSLIGKSTEDLMGIHKPSAAVHLSTSPPLRPQTHTALSEGQGLGMLKKT